MPELVLHVSDIDEVGKDYDFELSEDWLDAILADTSLRSDRKAGGGQLHVHAQRNGQEYLVRGQVDAHLVTECGRCLGPAPFHVDSEMTALLTPGEPGEQPAEVELEAEDLDRVRFTGPDLVLDELVREHMVLECPMQPLCSPECEGLQVPERLRPRPEDFGAEGDVDPRLAPLEKLRAKLSGDKE
ncbi:MAG: DUF177 domain-containing protein [Myxococcales bacterium]|jgi:uncharacterized protein